ncbi:EscU/YscU/HrcU family type III secretion system export apparatus switch protein [Oceanobacillus salinisoli]|uniref:EscU/YscU/HrcU family type III secretion system export apparatus switch protein n=1 Tax=Oceanobacillus salinisoli TaxID=2678611 RepID=UPI0012E0CEDD|nr:EscU/YscU/HrcU family type III secretion system export apparatus switch protein [Oceanobacillus salinisoli]
MTNMQKKAAALKYDLEKNAAPVLSASGKGLIAEEIIERATKNNIPILEDPSLVELLAKLNINETIPAELYEAVAEVFAFIYRTDQSLEKKI